MKRLLLILLVFTTTISLVGCKEDAKTESTKESVYDRVMRTGELRCGYFSWYPAIIKDPKTGELNGIYHDFMQELGKTLSLEIVFAEEIGLGDYPAALESGRVDAMCGASWLIGERARQIDFVMPLFYLPLYGFSRVDDNRFDKNIDILNDEKYTIAVLEGGATATVRRKIFPKSKAYEIPQLISPAELFVSLDLKKADAVIYDLFTYGDFNKHNPDKIKRITSEPIKVYPNIVGIKRGEDEFRQMLTHAYTDLLLSGTLDRIIDKHETYKESIFRVAKPYGAER